MKLKKNHHRNYYNIIITKKKAPLDIIENIGSLKINKITKLRFIKLKLKRIKFWLVHGIHFSYESMKILSDLNLLPKPKHNLIIKKL